MTALQPYARLIDMRSNTVVASTTNLVAGRIGRVMDKPGPRMVTVPIGDAGDSADTAHGFAAALLAATGGPSLSATPVPTLIEISLDGGTTIDARWMVEKVTPDLHGSELVLVCEGDDSGVLYNATGPDRFPATNLALADCLGGTAGNIIPLTAGNYGISSVGAGNLGKIPNLRGLLVPTPGAEPGATPGSPMWVAGAQARIAMTGVLSNALSSVIAFLGVNIQSWEDTAGRVITSLVRQLGGVVFAADTADQGSRGHAVWCDSDVNLSGDIAGVVCDGSPTLAAPAGTNGFSNDATHHPTGVPRALVIGNVGGSPRGVAFTFDATSSAALTPAQEASTGRLLPEETTITPDLSTLYSEVRLTGGSSDAGIPQGAVLTALTTLNNIPADSPAIAYTDVLPILAANVQDLVGALYFDAGDSRLRLIPSYTLGLPIYDIAVDNGNGQMYIATAAGVWSHATAGLATSTVAWSKVGGLSAKVTRLHGVAGASSAFWLYAQVGGVSKDVDGVYQYNVGTPSAATGAGYDNWVRLVHEAVISMVATDGTSCFLLKAADQGAALWFVDTTVTSPTTPYHSWTLGTGVRGVRLDRVIVGASDSVWVSLSGGSQPAKYLLHGANWTGQSLQNADQDGSLVTAVGTATGVSTEPQVQRAVAVGYGINGVNVAVMLCTTVGVYYMPGTSIPVGGGTAWSGQANGMNGLAGVSIQMLAAGQATQVPNPNDPTTYVFASRLYAISGNAYYYSYSDARYWRDLLRFPLTLGPFFYSLASTFAASWTSGGTPGTAGAQTGAVFTATAGVPYVGQVVLIDTGASAEAVTLTAVSGAGPYTCSFTTTKVHTLSVAVKADLPSFGVQTIGPGASSPIGAGAGSHVQVVGCLPTGWYWRRRWGYTLEPSYAAVNSTVPYPAVLDEPITELAVTPSEGILAASTDLATMAVILLGERSTKQTTLSVQSLFTQQESGLRYLWPTHQVAVSQTGDIKMLSSAGALVDMTYINLVAQAMYVLEHEIAWDGPQFQTRSTLGTSVRGAAQTGADLIAGLVADSRRIRVHGLRAKR